MSEAKPKSKKRRRAKTEPRAQENRSEVRFGGTGGQGVILAGYILGRAATVFGGRNAAMSQSYGPESRGGACMADLVIADGEIAYPRIGSSPDVAVMMSQAAYLKHAGDLPKDCTLILDEDLVRQDETTGKHRRVLTIPSTTLAEGLGRRLVANIVVLGFMSKTTDVVDEEAMRQAVLASVPKGTEELNMKAFEAGREHASKSSPGKNGQS